MNINYAIGGITRILGEVEKIQSTRLLPLRYPGLYLPLRFVTSGIMLSVFKPSPYIVFV